MGSPGSGKTALLEATARALGAGRRLAAMSGDLATDHDAERLRKAGIPSLGITTGSGCHLDARLVHDGLHKLDLHGADLLFLENVGNLVCPAIYDLGQAANVVALSVTEGEDKPLKYPVMFRKADLVVLTKVDLLPHLDVHVDQIEDALARTMPNPRMIRVSAKTGEGIDAWTRWLAGLPPSPRDARAPARARARPRSWDASRARSRVRARPPLSPAAGRGRRAALLLPVLRRCARIPGRHEPRRSLHPCAQHRPCSGPSGASSRSSRRCSASLRAGPRSPSRRARRRPLPRRRSSTAFPMLMSYGILHQYFIDPSSGQYKCPFNQLFNEANVFTPKDTAVVTPNSDTPYSFVAMDLRAEPFVLTVPEVEKDRYYSIQLVDLYTFNYGYVGSRATGNAAASYLIAGPRWKGEAPAGVKQVFRCETDFSLGIYRTQLFRPDDLDAVRKVQAGYKAQPLSQFLKQPAPAAAPAIPWPKIDLKSAEADPFAYLAFLLQFCPPTGSAAVEEPLRARFAKLGIEAGKPFAVEGLSAERKAELVAGVRKGMESIGHEIATLGREENGWRVTLGAFGTREALKGSYLTRAAAAKAGIFGNTSSEAIYPMLQKDADGEKPDASKHRYTLTFAAGQLPPVKAFWSVTMYDAKTQLLVENPIHRYLINSPMMSGMKKDADGSMTLYLQKDSPGADKESNWLPAPDGPIYVVMRLYWPEEAAATGAWKVPAVQVAK